MMCCLLPAMPRYSTCLHALCSLLFWAPSCYNTGKIPYFLKSACKAAKLHGNILPDSRTLRCDVQVKKMHTWSAMSSTLALSAHTLLIEVAATSEERSRMVELNGTLSEKVDSLILASCIRSAGVSTAGLLSGVSPSNILVRFLVPYT